VDELRPDHDADFLACGGFVGEQRVENRKCESSRSCAACKWRSSAALAAAQLERIECLRDAGNDEVRHAATSS
jgi:hypothetical protein